MDSFIIFIILLVILITLLSLFLLKISKKNKKTINNDVNLNKINKINETNEIHSNYSLWEIEPYDQSMLEEYKSTHNSLTINRKLKEQVENIIKLTPYAKELRKRKNEVVIKFNNDIMQKIQTGELHLMNKKNSLNEFRTMAVDSKGKIRAHGWEEINEIKKINPAQMVNLAFGVMTIITAQEHLDRINKQLTKIDEKVDFLIRNISQEKRGGLQGNIRYLKSLMPDILQGSYGFESSNYGLIEDITKETYKEIQFFINNINDLILELNNVDSQTQFRADTLIDTITVISRRFNEASELCYGNIELMNICLSLKSELLNTKSFELRISDVENYITNLENFEDEFVKIFYQKINSFDVRFNIRFKPSEYIRNKKQDLQYEVEYLKRKILLNRNNNVKADRLLKRRDNLLEGPSDLKVKYDNQGNILAIHKLERNN